MLTNFSERCFAEISVWLRTVLKVKKKKKNNQDVVTKVFCWLLILHPVCLCYASSETKHHNIVRAARQHNLPTLSKPNKVAAMRSEAPCRLTLPLQCVWVTHGEPHCCRLRHIDTTILKLCMKIRLNSLMMMGDILKGGKKQNEVYKWWWESGES